MRLGAVVHEFMRQEAGNLITFVGSRPVLFSGSNDGTLMKTAIRIISGGDLHTNSVATSGKDSCEFLLQRALFEYMDMGKTHDMLSWSSPTPSPSRPGRHATASSRSFRSSANPYPRPTPAARVTPRPPPPAPSSPPPLGLVPSLTSLHTHLLPPSSPPPPPPPSLSPLTPCSPRSSPLTPLPRSLPLGRSPHLLAPLPAHPTQPQPFRGIQPFRKHLAQTRGSSSRSSFQSTIGPGGAGRLPWRPGRP